MNLEQIFLKSERQDTVVKSLIQSLEKFSFVLRTKELPKQPLPRGPKLKRWRHFWISVPVNGWVGVFEDMKLTDRGIAKDCSLILGTEAIWIAYSETTEQFAFQIYRNGLEEEQSLFKSKDGSQSQVVTTGEIRERTQSELELYDTAQAFYEQHSLPLRFYNYESIDSAAKKGEFVHLNFENTAYKSRFS